MRIGLWENWWVVNDSWTRSSLARSKTFPSLQLRAPVSLAPPLFLHFFSYIYHHLTLSLYALCPNLLLIAGACLLCSSFPCLGAAILLFCDKSLLVPYSLWHNPSAQTDGLYPPIQVATSCTSSCFLTTLTSLHNPLPLLPWLLASLPFFSLILPSFIPPSLVKVFYSFFGKSIASIV